MCLPPRLCRQTLATDRPEYLPATGVRAGFADTGSLVCLVLIAAAAILYAHVYREAPFEAPDTSGYMAAARDLMDGSIDSLQDRTPGYPLILLATGSTSELTRSLFLTSLALHLLAVSLVLGILRSLGLRQSMLVVAAILALRPALTEPATWALSETTTEISVVLGVAALYVYWKRGIRSALIIAGLAFGYAALTRPSYAPVGLAASLALGALSLASGPVGRPLRRILRQGAVLTGLPVAMTAGYALFNAVRFDYPGVSPILAASLSQRVTNLYEFLPDSGVRAILLRWRAKAYVTGGNPAWAFFPATEELERYTGKSRLELYQSMVPLVLRVIAKHPEAYFEAVVLDFAAFWFPRQSTGPPAAKAAEYLIHYATMGFFCLLLAVLVTFGFLSWAGRLRFERSPTVVLQVVVAAVAIVLSNAVLTCALNPGEPRYRSPTDLLILLAIFGGWLWLKEWRESLPFNPAG